MGYRSKWMLHHIGPATVREVKDAVIENSEYKDHLDHNKMLVLADGSILVSGNWNGNDRMKWYTASIDMLAISAAIPDTTLVLDKIGEEWEPNEYEVDVDVTRKVYLGGVLRSETRGRSWDGETAEFCDVEEVE